MTIGSGMNFYLYFKEEPGAYGTIADANVWQVLGPVESAPFEVAIERAKIAGIGSRKRIMKPVLKQVSALGFEVPLQLTTNWLLLKDIDDTTLKQYSLCAKGTFGGTTYYIYFYGVYLNEAEVSWELNEIIKANFKFDIQKLAIFEAEQYAGTSYEAQDTSDPQVWKDGGFEVVSGFSNTGAIDSVDSFSVTIKNNYEPKFGWTNAYPQDSQEKGFDVDGLVTRDLEDFNQLEEILAEEEGVLKLHVSGSNYIQINGANWDKWSGALEELELLDQDIPFTGDSVTFN